MLRRMLSLAALASVVAASVAGVAEADQDPSARAAVPLLVTVSRYQFSPGGPYGPPIRLQAGTTYTLVFRATDTEHGISSVPELNIFARSLVPGQDYVVTVTPTPAQVGRYTFACTMICGSGHSDMAGAIEVEAAEEAPALLLGDGRFRATTTYRTADGATGSGQPVFLTSDAGYFWFFDAANVEVVVKALDGCSVNGHSWVFAAGLTNLEVVLSVTDTLTAQTRTYSNPQGSEFLPIQDAAAFDACP
jgi:hypothetical protein